tara:strand:- start:660 stop:848 length:189 start_codon:yes stop_codon:yes gene_type:complete
MKQLYDLGVKSFWFTDAQFIPSKNILKIQKYYYKLLKSKDGMTFIGLHKLEPIILMLISRSL